MEPHFNIQYSLFNIQYSLGAECIITVISMGNTEKQRICYDLNISVILAQSWLSIIFSPTMIIFLKALASLIP